MSAEVYGTAADVAWSGEEMELVARDVNVPANALAVVSEGFCPACAGVRLASDTGKWCLSCGVSWHIRRAG